MHTQAIAKLMPPVDVETGQHTTFLFEVFGLAFLGSVCILRSRQRPDAESG